MFSRLKRMRLRRGSWILGAILWLLLLSAGFAAVNRYAFTPGVPAAAPALWPSDSALAQRSGRPTLVMLAQPRCSCTHASLRELERLMADVTGRVDAFVLFVAPEGEAGPTADDNLWRLASKIPGVQVRADPGGREARRFDAHTAGQVVFYDAAGRLVFSGGITSGRGHEGDNAGRSSIVALARETGAADSRSHVFGCTLAAEPVRVGRP